MQDEALAQHSKRSDWLKEEWVITSFSISKTRNGESYVKMVLALPNGTETFPAVIWRCDWLRLSQSLRLGNVVRILKYCSSDKYPVLTIKDLSVVKDGIIGLSEEQRNDLFAILQSNIASITNENLRNFVTLLVSTYKEEFKICPAAIQHHHNYVGGLLKHTVETLNFTNDFLDRYHLELPQVNRDIYCAACILHDFFKIWEYSINLENGAATYNDEFAREFVSHSLLGYFMCREASLIYNDSAFIYVAIMIAAHHGYENRGAIINLWSLPAIFHPLHTYDDLSAKKGDILILDIGRGFYSGEKVPLTLSKE